MSTGRSPKRKGTRVQWGVELGASFQSRLRVLDLYSEGSNHGLDSYDHIHCQMSKKRAQGGWGGGVHRNAEVGQPGQKGVLGSADPKSEQGRYLGGGEATGHRKGRKRQMETREELGSCTLATQNEIHSSAQVPHQQALPWSKDLCDPFLLEGRSHLLNHQLDSTLSQGPLNPTAWRLHLKQLRGGGGGRHPSSLSPVLLLR